LWGHHTIWWWGLHTSWRSAHRRGVCFRRDWCRSPAKEWCRVVVNWLSGHRRNVYRHKYRLVRRTGCLKGDRLHDWAKYWSLGWRLGWNLRWHIRRGLITELQAWRPKGFTHNCWWFRWFFRRTDRIGRIQRRRCRRAWAWWKSAECLFSCSHNEYGRSSCWLQTHGRHRGFTPLSSNIGHFVTLRCRFLESVMVTVTHVSRGFESTDGTSRHGWLRRQKEIDCVRDRSRSWLWRATLLELLHIDTRKWLITHKCAKVTATCRIRISKANHRDRSKCFPVLFRERIVLEVDTIWQIRILRWLFFNKRGRRAVLRSRVVSVGAESNLVDLDGIDTLAKMAVKPSGFLFDRAFQGTQEPEDTLTEIRVRKVETTHRLHQ
jgi:hypothetical protein